MVDDSQGSQTSFMDVMKLWFMSLGLCYFIFLVSFDLWTSLKSKPRTQWIPGKALILSALTIQVLTYLNYENINFSDKPEAAEYAKLLGNQSVIDSGRLVICVFIGYMLPGMAKPGSAAQWGDISALVISLFTAITSELYYIHKVNKIVNKVDYGYTYEVLWDLEKNPSIKLWFVVSSLAVLVCTVMLILFLILAILAGRTVGTMIAKRIPPILERSSTACGFEDKIVRSWFFCRVGKPQYVIARSVLSSSTGMVLTVFIVFFVVKGRVLESRNVIYQDDGWDWLRYITFGLQCIFVLFGWAVILLRWFSAVFYFSTFSLRSTLCQKCSVEDFWTRSICEILYMYDIHQWPLEEQYNNDRKCMAKIVGLGAKLYKILYLVLGLPKFLVFFSKCCFFISEILLLVFKFVPKCVPDREHYPEYQEYKEILTLLCMPGEDPLSLWLANKKAFHQAQDRLKVDSSSCEDLKRLLKEHFSRSEQNASRFVDQLKHLQLVEDYFPALTENCWKITAVSLIKIIKKVSSPSRAQLCVNACKQAWDLMTFTEGSSFEQPNTINVVEVFDIEFDPISMAADKELKMLEPGETHTTDTTNPKQEAAHRTIQKLLREAEQKLQAQKVLCVKPNPQENGNVHADLLDSKDWNLIAPSYNMYIVCNHILNSSLSGNELVDKLHYFLGDVIGDCLKKLPEVLERSCSAWAVEFEEEKIWEAIYLAGKIKAVLPECSTFDEAQMAQV